MKLIVGLGNPEKQYDGTRHNVGFAILDSYAKHEGSEWQEKPKLKAWVAKLSTPEKVLLIKPTTYYNLSGESVRAAADFYKIPPENILIIHDDHALPFGSVRTREQGRDAGNNGIKSVNAHMGPTTRRVRVGTGSELRDKISDADYALGKFSADERLKLPEISQKIAHVIDDFIDDKFFVTTHRN